MADQPLVRAAALQAVLSEHVARLKPTGAFGTSEEWRFFNALHYCAMLGQDSVGGVFDAVLSPDYNAAHHDHLHLDRGPFRMCR